MYEAADLRLIIRACGALALMSVRYWTTAAAPARRQIGRWREDAERIPDLALRELALTKLAEEKTNAYFAATFATLAPRAQRPVAIEAIVALQIIYDYLDGLSEQPTADSLSDGLALFGALSDGVSLASVPDPDYYRHHAHRDDGGYLPRLVATARAALAKLPAVAAITGAASAAAAYCAEAQVRAHAAARLGTEQLEQWASEQAPQDGAPWREFLAASASAIISIHALIAAAADPRTSEDQAALIDRFYFRATCVLATVLDGLADRQQDEASADADVGYLHYFPEGETLSQELVAIARGAIRQAPRVPHGGHHLMTLAGVVAYYTSTLEYNDSSSRTAVAPLQHELAPVITPALAFMRLWHFGEHQLRPRDAT
jgi:tetraprenyl-beta-curcumene synthase